MKDGMRQWSIYQTNLKNKMFILILIVATIICCYLIRQIVFSIENLKCYYSKGYRSIPWHHRYGMVFNTKTGKLEASNELKLPFE